MTTRLPDEPMRVTNWLAGWVDYMFAIALVAGRWLRLPLTQPDPEPGFRSAFAPTMPDSFAPRWHEGEPKQRSGPLVKAAEIVMLSISFFLAAHLLSGGTPTAVAPNLNPLNLLSDANSARTTVVPAEQLQINVPAAQMIVTFGDRPEAAVTTETAALLPLPEDAAAIAASVPEAEAPVATTPDVAVPVEPPATQPETPVVVAPPAPPVLAVVQEPAGRYMSTDEVRAAVVAAGWPANLVDDVVNVAWCESRFYTHAQYYGALGMMQMMPLWFDPAGLDKAMWGDPVTNFRAALFAYQDSEARHGDPWLPWTCKPDHGLNTPE